MDENTYRITRLGHKGDGIAEGPVFAARALPGETVSGVPDAGRIAAPRIVTPSPDRVRPPCRHYNSCGGCALQHASDGFVAGWKAEIVAEALAAQGLEAEVTALHTSPPESRRRAVLAGIRTKKDALVGFYARASETVAAIPDCQVLQPAIRAAFPALRALTRAGASRKGALRIAVTAAENGLDIAVTGGKPMDGPLRASLGRIAGEAGFLRLSWEGEPVAMAERPRLAMGRAMVSPPPGAFLQATAEGASALVGAVRAAIGPAKRVVDLFAGCGTFALPLAETVEVHAVESEAEMLAALDEGWRHGTGLHRVTTETRDLFRRPLLAQELARFDAIAIDPPRAGAAQQTEEIAKSGVPRIAAISCNPVTFARDAKCLTQAGYRLGPVRVVDQFRWSPHVELAASFTSGDISDH